MQDSYLQCHATFRIIPSHMKPIRRLGLLLVLYGRFLQTADACTCTDYGVPTCALFAEADAVFVGKVVRITSAAGDKDANVSLGGVGSISSSGPGLVWVHFAVERGFKGISGLTAKALTYRGTSCDLEIKTGQRWVIFAHRDRESGALNFGACGGNSQVEKNDSTVAELRMMAAAKQLIVRGRVANQTYEVVKGASVKLSGNGVNLQTTTGDDGAYSFEVPKAAAYKIEVVVPFSASLLRFAGDERPIEATPEETQTLFQYSATPSIDACDYQFFDTYKIDLKATASISGVFLLDNWKYVPQFYPSICRLTPTEKETLERCKTDYYGLKPDGSFKFEGFREGTYTIVINDDDFLDGSSPVRRHYYPGVREFEKAEPIVLDQGGEKTGIRFKLPPMVPLREVKGQLFRKDGSTYSSPPGQEPYFRAYQYEHAKEPKFFFIHSYVLDRGEGREGREVEMLNVSNDGKFTASLFEGNSYILTFETDSNPRKWSVEW
jgi:hypothetical protein